MDIGLCAKRAGILMQLIAIPRTDLHCKNSVMTFAGSFRLKMTGIKRKAERGRLIPRKSRFKRGVTA